MKRKIIFTTALFVLAHSNAFAHTIQNGQMISHKIFTSPGSKGSVKIMKQPQIKTQQFGDVEYNELISAQAFVYTKTVHEGEDSVSSHVSVSISNESLSSQSYTIYTELCLSSYNARVQTPLCVKVEDVVTLGVHGSIDYSTLPALTHYFDATENQYDVAIDVLIKNNSTLAAYHVREHAQVHLEAEQNSNK